MWENSSGRHIANQYPNRVLAEHIASEHSVGRTQHRPSSHDMQTVCVCELRGSPYLVPCSIALWIHGSL